MIKPEWLDKIERNIEHVTPYLSYINRSDYETLISFANKALEALEGVKNSAFTTYKAKNGRDVGIQDEGGEMCYIVPHEPMRKVEEALSAINQEGE